MQLRACGVEAVDKGRKARMGRQTGRSVAWERGRRPFVTKERKKRPGRPARKGHDTTRGRSSCWRLPRDGDARVRNERMGWKRSKEAKGRSTGRSARKKGGSEGNAVFMTTPVFPSFPALHSSVMGSDLHAFPEKGLATLTIVGQD